MKPPSCRHPSFKDKRLQAKSDGLMMSLVYGALACGVMPAVTTITFSTTKAFLLSYSLDKHPDRRTNPP